MNTEITFNVIFVRDTVPILAWMLRSLEAWSTHCRFRLVSNGCRESENQVLQQMCVGNKRLEFQQVSQDRVLEHGKVLTQLQRQESSPYFAFMDSDILATGPFLPEFHHCLSTASAVFSCPPVWSNDEMEVFTKGFQILHGEHNRLPNGFCLGGTYFAIYRNDTLSQCVQETGVTFELHWWKGITEGIQQELQSAGMAMELYDTGKLLNILMGLRGFQCRFVRSKHLLHVGGTSGLTMGRQRRFFGLLPRGISAKSPAFVLKFFKQLNLYRGCLEILDSVERDFFNRKALRKASVCSYLTELLQSLVDGETWTEPFVDDDQELTNKVRQFEAHLRQAFAQHQPAAARRPQAA